MRRFLTILCFIFLSSLLAGCTLLQKEKKSGLQVITHDIPSSVFIDGQYLNKTPLIEKQLQPGQHIIRIEPDDSSYIPHETTVNLRPGVLTVITWKSAKRPELSGGVMYEMEKISSKTKSEVSFITIPDGAIITLEGREKEFSPVTISDISPGSLAYEVTLPSYETQSHTVEVAAGYRMIVNVKLAKLDPTLDKPASIQLEADNTSSTSATATASATKTTTATASATSKSATTTEVLILPTNFFQDGKEVLRVRNNPGSLGAEIGFAETGKTYPYLNEETNGWYKITFENKTGWVTKEYAKLQ